MQQPTTVQEAIQHLHKQFNAVESDELCNLLSQHYDLPENIVSLTLYLEVNGIATMDYEYLEDDFTIGYRKNYFLRKKESN